MTQDLKKTEDMMQQKEQPETEKVSESILSKKDVNKLFFRWYMLCEMSNSFERLQSLAFCSAISPALKSFIRTRSGFQTL